ncbi:uncharacterized protein LOC121884736 [Thunnus maccoyii]|uniref:uncharacterized protein LOC121884736 n=1 Tax=Thunnus maccoyii TaxID=8240 RepID=UPI001C4B3195|nr:uncharacterized protein LOC121884736 [Thunnus maccoyii]
MASLQSVLLASSIILLYWTIASTQSHDPTNFSQCYRVKRDLAPGSKDQADKTLNTVKDSLSVFKDVMEKIDTKKVSAVMQGLASFASVAPGIGGLVSSIINMVLVFIPQNDPVLIEVKKGFAEVNRKLDSLSVQLSSLTADVEWFNYASVYSQDEMRIVNAWKKFNEFRENSELVQSQEDKLRLAEIFTNYFENTATEPSVANLYHYLTVNSTSLSGNLNDLLRKKFKCDIGEIAKYNFYFSSLLWKGMVLNQLYWSLIGFNSSGKEAQHTQMFKDVSRAQLSAVEFCLDNYEQYMKEDVVKISKELSPDNKQDIAEKVKKALDEKYNWYRWMVLVYDTNREKNFILFDVTKIPVGEITVAVGYTLKVKVDVIELRNVKKLTFDCLHGKDCEKMSELVPQCATETEQGVLLQLNKYVKVTYVSYGKDFALILPPLFRVECRWGHSTSDLYVYYSHIVSACGPDTCKNGGECKRLLDSNERFCICPDGYYGDTCEENSDTSKAPTTHIHQPVPDITTINTKLNMIESKLQEILTSINERCPAQQQIPADR